VIVVDLSGNNLSNVGANHIRQAFHVRFTFPHTSLCNSSSRYQ